MKTTISSALMLIISMVGFSQAIWIANNNTGAVPGPKVKTGATALSDAIAAAANGDIIYVVPGGSTYNTTLVNKSVSIFGSGFNPDKTSSMTSNCQSITVSANNVRLSGLMVSRYILVSAGFSGTLIDKCRVERFEIGAVGSTIIQNCIFGESTSSFTSLSSDLTSSSLRLSNNIIYGTTNGWLRNLGGAIIENNVFVGFGGQPDFHAFDGVMGCTIRNNIFFGVQPRGVSAPGFLNNNQQNNLSFGATDNSFVDAAFGNVASNNIVGQDPQFVNLPVLDPSVYNNSYDAHLKTTSPAIGTGFGGIDMGVYGGLTPFDPFGTSLPIVKTITAAGSVLQGTNMNVRVQGKGN